MGQFCDFGSMLAFGWPNESKSDRILSSFMGSTHKQMKRVLSFIIFFLIGLIALSFALLNAEEVKINYYIGSTTAALSFVMVLSVAAGAVMGIIASLGLVLKLKREISKLHKVVKTTEKEITNLRSIPIKDIH